MKFCSIALTIAIGSASLLGCGSSSEVTVNPAPEMTNEEIEQMDAESDRAREEAIRDGM
ncbi:putative secreted protein [Rhodopirellula maiorica SM1]|uniref:Putative secreted protein n=1 Tax=Rhodopirellula maiorica SM1 TaxID=1265738 RepID=M5RSR2_9BACT|nr:hypothetical protein [Rhodopirellula maiorica]EMI18427.1 putative secreted protein [Rhodopirellula maiorica SM1]